MLAGYRVTGIFRNDTPNGLAAQHGARKNILSHGRPPILDVDQPQEALTLHYYGFRIREDHRHQQMLFLETFQCFLL
jgi:hypothetical protein